MTERYEPEASRLRRLGLLWPENLSDEALRQELDSARSDTQPISVRMLRDEDDRRRRRLRIGADYWHDGLHLGRASRKQRLGI